MIEGIVEYDEELVLSGKICPYCGLDSDYTDSKEVYKRISYGMIYLCRPCEAWVGVHKGTDLALGRLANKKLRDLKKEVHRYFDPLWKKKMSQGFNKAVARGKAYKWLSEQLDITVQETHIGMFDKELCRKAVEACKPYHINNGRRK